MTGGSGGDPSGGDGGDGGREKNERGRLSLLSLIGQEREGEFQSLSLQCSHEFNRGRNGERWNEAERKLGYKEDRGM